VPITDGLQRMLGVEFLIMTTVPPNASRSLTFSGQSRDRLGGLGLDRVRAWVYGSQSSAGAVRPVAARVCPTWFNYL